MDTFGKFIDGMNKVLGFIIAIMLSIMSVVVIIQVIFRILKMALPWSEEISRYLMIYIAFLGTAYAVRYDLLMAVTILQEKLSQQAKIILSIFIYTLLIAFFLVLTIYGIEVVKIAQRQVSPAMQIPMSIPYFAIVVGSIMAILNCIYVCLTRVLHKGGTV